MSIIKNTIDQRLQAYIDNLFSGVGASQQLFDLKEELTTNIKEKISDYKAQGMTDDQAFKEAIISMGDLSGLVDDMRKLGQDSAKQTVYTTMTSRVSTAGIIAGVLLVLFGIFTSTMLYFMNLPRESVTGTGIFIVAGGALLTYSVLTRETRKRYGMNKIRAALYALAIGLILFSIFTATVTTSATGEVYIGIASLMVFFLSGMGLLLFLLLTGTISRKKLI
ncbi:permease prefix domain 1-containing protein [Desulfotomaculum sp. 1211_IL3151]|uniref:permease prefix domain 1-containing protein n=1 Tax=Desulfotomaculum sp. 1211_IL3151 TaxID=3084055 RepID=UPI002FDAC6F9